MTKKFRRIVIGGVAAAVLLLVVVVWLVVETGGTGEARVERWIRGQLQGVAGSYLNPDLEFTELDYQYPDTITLSGATLTAADPAGGPPINIIEADAITLTLAERPRIGEPLRVQKFVLDRPVIRVVSVGPDSPDLVGFSSLVKQDDQPDEDEPDEDEPSEPVNLSDVFEIREIKLVNGSVIVDPRREDLVPMQIDDINTTLNVQPQDGAWYDIATVLEREGVFKLAVNGKANIDTFAADLAELSLDASLGPEYDHYLPPQLQELRKAHDLTGVMAIVASGTMGELGDDGLPTIDLKTRINLKDVKGDVEGYRVNVPKLDLEAHLADNTLHIDGLSADVFQGNLLGQGTIQLTGAQEVDMKIDLSRINLERVMASLPDTKKEDRRPGLINGRITMQAPARTWNQAASGTGSVEITKTRLVGLPVLDQLGGAIMKDKAPARDAAPDENGADVDAAEPTGSDKVLANFELAGDRVRFTGIDIDTRVAKLTGKGDLTFDGGLDLRFKGGAVEKLNESLGAVGRAISSVSSALTTYLITGTVEDVIVKVVAGGSLEKKDEPEAEAEAGQKSENLIDKINPF